MTATTVARLLGGPAVVQSTVKTPADWIKLVRRGLPAAAIDAIARAVQLTQAELSQALAIPERTLIRRKKEGMLNTDESAKLLRVARITYRAFTVFEDHTAALDWLKSPNRALGGAIPLSLLDTDLGADAVLDTIGRIEYGVFT